MCPKRKSPPADSSPINSVSKTNTGSAYPITDPISRLRELIETPSIFPNEQKIGELLERRLRELGFATKRIPLADDPSRFNVVGERGTIGAPLLFYGHMDTVPIYGQWEKDPFTMHEEDGRLYGLGAYDMKAGVAAILCACEEKTEQRIKVAFGADEENISAGAWALAKSGFLHGVSFAVVPEIEDSLYASPHPNSIMLGRRGRAVYEFDVPGQSAHGAHIRSGVSAIDEAARLCLELDRLNERFHPQGAIPEASQFIRKIEGESTSLTLPEAARLELDRHLVAPETSASVLVSLQRYTDELYARGVFQCPQKRIQIRLKSRSTPYLEPYHTDSNLPQVQRLAGIVREEVAEPAFTYGFSVADENVLASCKIPVVSYGPRGANFHSANEWVDKAGYLSLVRVLRRFVREQTT